MEEIIEEQQIQQSPVRFSEESLAPLPNPSSFSSSSPSSSCSLIGMIIEMIFLSLGDEDQETLNCAKCCGGLLAQVYIYIYINTDIFIHKK